MAAPNEVRRAPSYTGQTVTDLSGRIRLTSWTAVSGPLPRCQAWWGAVAVPRESISISHTKTVSNIFQRRGGDNVRAWQWGADRRPEPPEANDQLLKFIQ